LSLSKIMWENVVPWLAPLDSASFCALGDAFFPLIPKIVKTVLIVGNAKNGRILDIEAVDRTMRCCISMETLKTAKYIVEVWCPTSTSWIPLFPWSLVTRCLDRRNATFAKWICTVLLNGDLIREDKMKIRIKVLQYCCFIKDAAMLTWMLNTHVTDVHEAVFGFAPFLKATNDILLNHFKHCPHAKIMHMLCTRGKLSTSAFVKEMPDVDLDTICSALHDIVHRKHLGVNAIFIDDKLEYECKS
jgi:hypothetical protein